MGRLDSVRALDDQRLVEREPRLPRLVREVASEGVARDGFMEPVGIGMAFERAPSAGPGRVSRGRRQGEAGRPREGFGRLVGVGRAGTGTASRIR
jgi:hypothetical protein